MCWLAVSKWLVSGGGGVANVSVWCPQMGIEYLMGQWNWSSWSGCCGILQDVVGGEVQQMGAGVGCWLLRHSCSSA